MVLPQSYGADGRYAVVDRLGQGGMGTLFVAEDRVLRRRVALKLLREELRERPEARARFLREAMILARLEHPNLARVFEVELAPPSFLVMELLDGEDLERRLATGRLLSSAEARRLAAEMAEALAYLHERQILHRDLKPANVFLGSDGRSRLLDFGLSLPTDLTRLTSSGQLLGTPLFLPPEVARGGDYVAASDVYQAGLVLHLALTGRHPFEDAEDAAALYRRLCSGPPVPVRVDPGLPDDLASLVAACVGSAPAARPADGAALAALAALAANVARRVQPARATSSALTMATAPITPAPAPAPRPAAANLPPRAAPAAVALLLAALAAALLTLRTSGGPDGPRAVREVGDVAREYALLPDGLALALLPSAARAPACLVEADGQAPRRVPLVATPGGWAASVEGLPPGSRGTLTVLDGGRPLARSSFALPPTTLAGPATARFGLDAVEVSWALHGRAAVDVLVEVPRTREVLRSRSLRAPALVRLPAPGRNEPVRWRLELHGAPLAAGAGLVGLDWRYAKRPGLPRPRPANRREDQPALVGPYVVFLHHAGSLAALAATSSASGTRFTTVAAATPDDLAPPAGSHAFLSIAADGPRGLLVLATSSSAGALLRLPVPWAAEPRPDWTLRLPDHRERALAVRLADGRLLLATSVKKETPDGLRPAGGALEVIDTATGTLGAATGTIVAAMRTPLSRTMVVVPFGDGALVVARRDGRTVVLRVTGGPTPALDGWTLELPGAIDVLGEDYLTCAACPAGRDGSALLLYGTTAHLVTPGPTPGVRSVPLPVAPGSYVPAVAGGPDGTFLAVAMGALGPGIALAGTVLQGSRLQLVQLEFGPDGALAATPTAAPRTTFREAVRAVDSGLLRHGGRVYVNVGMQFLAFRDAPGHDFVGDWLAPENAFCSPFVAGGCVLVACRDSGVVGFDLLDGR